MAKPRVFISSTFFDLKQVRETIDTFIISMGFIPIRNEEGNIPYGINDYLDEDCYDEVDQSDILVSIIGSRYGSEATSGGASISQRELEHAIYLGKQVYIFVDQNVLAEYETYKLNRNSRKFKYKHVDNIKIYEFMDALQELGNNKPMFSFQTAKDIIRKLQEQWAGLFQRLLQLQEEKTKYNVVQHLENTSDTLNSMIRYILEREDNKDVYREIILKTNHPAFTRLSQVLSISYKIIFSNFSELNSYLRHIGFLFPDKHEYSTEHNLVWVSRTDHILIISKKIFIEEDTWNLNYFTFDDWDDNFIQLIQISSKQEVAAGTE